jgi:tetratricopeptide (TPR) repeat protein
VSPALLAALLLLEGLPVPPEARQLKEAGDRRRAAGDAAGAREAYQAAVAAFDGFAEAHEALGEVFLGEKRFHDAAREFERAAGIEPELALAWYNLGYAARRTGDLGRARDAWRRYLALRPDDLDARLGLAEALRGLGEREAALEAYQAFVELAQPLPDEAGRVEKARLAMAELRAEAARPSPSGRGQPAELAGPAPGPAAPRSARQEAAQQKLRLGDRLLAEGDERLALFAYQDAVNQDPRNAEARLKLGRVYATLEHLPEALEQFSVAVALDPGDAEARRALEETRARLEGRAPPPGAPIIVRVPAGGSLEPPPATRSPHAAEPLPAAAPAPAAEPKPAQSP